MVPRLSELCATEIAFDNFDLTNVGATRAVFELIRLEAVIHFEGFEALGESVVEPCQYYLNNLDSVLSVVDLMGVVGCDVMVFSSSATVYGNTPAPLDKEQYPLSSVSPYGWTGVMTEQILTDIAHVSGVRAALL